MTAVLQPLQRAIAAHQRQLAHGLRAFASSAAKHSPCARAASNTPCRALRGSPRTPALAASPTLRPAIPAFTLRAFASSAILRAAQPPPPAPATTPAATTTPPPADAGFERSEKATRAALVNLSARLHKDGKAPGAKAGQGEIRRLLRIARPEAKWLGGARPRPRPRPPAPPRR